ncbi:MAG: hypothetical protein MSC43_02845 [Clostridiales bacterium]|nr:hypothetical protein [Clostridiales bacterium]MDD7432176.1 hypothetical protein [Clostridiales bacterium]MDY3061538.1 hypothetical protein [Eubacteriales bacterium]
MDITESCPQAKARGQLFLAFFEVLRQDKKGAGLGLRFFMRLTLLLNMRVSLF